MHGARERAEGAHRYLHEGNVSRGIDEVIEALKLDPKCTEAYMVLQEYKWRTLPLLPAQVSMIKRYSKDGHRTFCESLNRAMNGIASVKKYIENSERSGYSKYAEKLQTELESLEAEMCWQKGVAACLFSEQVEGQPLYLSEIVSRLNRLCCNIEVLRDKGLPNYDIWAHIVQDRNFMALLSVPQIQKLVNNFYNHTTKEMEDPRLVKLAMISMLNKRECVKELQGEMDGCQFFEKIENGLRKQFKKLELEMHCM